MLFIVFRGVLTALRCIITRALFISSLWFLAPSAFFVLVAWMILQDCDFRLWFTGLLPGDQIRSETFFEGKVAWVVGASAGVGRAVALALAQRGAYVIVSGRRMEQLQVVAEDCSRAHLVAKIRNCCPRSPSRIEHVIDEASEPSNPRTLAIQLDLKKTEGMEEHIQVATAAAVQWKGHIDILVNAAGLREKALLPPCEAEDDLLHVNCASFIRLIRALLPGFQETSIKSLKEGHFSPSDIAVHTFRRLRSQPDVKVTQLMRQASVVGFQKGTEVVGRSSVARIFKRIILGERCEYTREVFIVNLSTVQTRLNLPGTAAYAAARAASDTYLANLARQMRAEANTCPYKAATKFTAITCLADRFSQDCTRTSSSLPGHNIVVSAGSLEDLKKNSGDLAELHKLLGSTVSQDNVRIAPSRAAELVLQGISHRLPECWIVKHPRLFYLYLQYYMPWVWELVAQRWIDEQVYLDAVLFNAKIDNWLDGNFNFEIQKSPR